MYLDPGFGSMLIQALVASLAAAGALIGIFWSKIRAFFSRGKKSVNSDDSDDLETTELETTENENE
jgi:hypothetical protein